MDDDNRRPRRVGRWDWPRLPRADAPFVVRQEDDDGCGVACAAMLLHDRGILVALEIVARGMPAPSEAEHLAQRLAQLAPFAWSGGSLTEGTVINWELVDYLTTSRGSWAALLEPDGPTQLGHWVVVDGITSDGLVLIRDPSGAAYALPLGDFAGLWGYAILVLQQVTP